MSFTALNNNKIKILLLFYLPLLFATCGKQKKLPLQQEPSLPQIDSSIYGKSITPGTFDTTSVENKYYTMIRLKVKKGKVQEFILNWITLGKTISKTEGNPDMELTLIQDIEQPFIFYALVPWKGDIEFEKLQKNKEVKEDLKQIIKLCSDITPGNFKTLVKFNYQEVKNNSESGQ